MNGACPVVRDAVSHAIEELPAIGSRFRWEIRDLPKRRKPHKWAVPGKTVTSARLRDHCVFRTSCWRRRTLAVKAEINTKQDLGSRKQIGQATELRLPIAKAKQTSGRSALQSSGTTQSQRSQTQSATAGRSTETTANNLGPVTGAQETNELKAILCRNDSTHKMNNSTTPEYSLRVPCRYLHQYVPDEGINTVSHHVWLPMVKNEARNTPECMLKELGLSKEWKKAAGGALVAVKGVRRFRRFEDHLSRTISMHVTLAVDLPSKDGGMALADQMDDAICELNQKQKEAMFKRITGRTLSSRSRSVV